MKDYDRKKESLYFHNQDVNNLYDWAMLQKLSVNSFQQIKDASQFIEDFIKKYGKQSNKEYFFEVDVQYTEKLHELRSDLPFVSKKIKVEKVEWLLANLLDKFQYQIHIKNLKQPLNHGLVLKKVNLDKAA